MDWLNSRTAIYERIRGNSKGHGGMIAKNLYVAIWWRTRQAREDGPLIAEANFIAMIVAVRKLQCCK
jgi:hypothetical protein